MRTDRGDETNSRFSSRAECLEIWENQPTVTLRACLGLYRDCFTLIDAVFNFANAAKNDDFN
jgi:hypothetical protein